jgi:hypothetical protein
MSEMLLRVIVSPSPRGPALPNEAIDRALAEIAAQLGAGDTCGEFHLDGGGFAVWELAVDRA